MNPQGPNDPNAGGPTPLGGQPSNYPPQEQPGANPPGGQQPAPDPYPRQPRPYPGQAPQEPGQYPQQPGQTQGQYPPQPGQFPQQPGQYPQQPGGYPQQPGQYPPSGQYPPQPNYYYGQQPGYSTQQVNGALILVIGILSIFCFGIILGPIAWVMGYNALKAINSGQADPSQKGMVQAGLICGIIGLVLAVIWMFWIGPPFMTGFMRGLHGQSGL